ncbi:hypothetical protein RCL1_000305 [Eukaryota sp. TZLM3-RCL]
MPFFVAHLKKLSGLAHSANTNRLFLPFHKGGLGLPHLVHLYQECQLQRVLILKNSYDQTILNLVKIRESKEMLKSKSYNPYQVALEYSKRHDESKNNQLSNAASRSLMVGWLKETNDKYLENQLSNLISHGEAARAHFNEGNESNATYEWLSMLIDLPPSVLKFGLNGLINTLPTANNLKLWKIQLKMPDESKIVSSHCMLCGNENDTLGNVLCYCDFIFNNGVFNRPKW